MIRITNHMMVNDLRRNLNSNLRNMDTYQTQLSSGRKINSLSDNPAGVVKSMRLRSSLTEGEQYLANISEAVNFMETTDSALSNINSILQRVRELTVNAANGTNDDSALTAISQEVSELNDQLKMIANSAYGTKYIFSGTNVTEQPYQDGANADNWVGNNGSLQVEISQGVTLAMNLTNESMRNLFTDSGTTQGLFNLLESLAADITAGDSDAINDALGALDNKMDDVLTCEAIVGAKINRLELQQARLESNQISLTGLLSSNEDADMAEVIMELKIQENVYQASLSAGARIIQPSLVDFLR